MSTTNTPPTAAECVAEAAEVLREAASLARAKDAETTTVWRLTSVAEQWRLLGATIAANPPAYALPPTEQP